MIEAFEIGVTLALRDGVSESIAQAQRNVEALQRAVDASGLSVGALRDAGARAVTLGNAQARHEQVRHKTASAIPRPELAGTAGAAVGTEWPVQSQGSDAPVAREPEQIEMGRVAEQASGEAPWDKSIAAPARFEPPPSVEQAAIRSDTEPHASSHDRAALGKLEFAAPIEERREAEPQVWTAAPAGQAKQGVPISRAGEQPLETYPIVQPGVAPRLETAEQPAATPSSNKLPSISLGQSSFSTIDVDFVEPNVFDARAAGAAEGGHPAPPAYSPAVQSLLQGVEGVPLDTQLGASAAPDTRRVGEEAPRQPTLLRGQEADDSDPHSAWASSSRNLHTVLTTALPQAGSMPQSVAPQSRGHAQEAPSGDVYLDGALVGRWISRFLKREVERADSGPTGFDAKRGRLLPGVTVGG